MKTITKIITILTVMALGFLFFPKAAAAAADSDIVISEIGAYEPSDHEWVEIYNKGNEPADLTGWKFFEDSTNHGLTAYQGDFIIEPGEYAIIADAAANFKIDYPDFTGTILDSSWTTLNEDGEALALKNKKLEIIENFTYLACPDTSLQKKDLTLADYTESNWLVHAAGNSAGRANEFETGNDNNNDNNPPPDDPPADDPPADEPPPNNPPADDPPTDDPPANNPINPGSILINEFVSDPADSDTEWIELYNNNGFSVDLSGWIILDGAETATELAGTIEAKGANSFFVIEKPKGQLNNSGDAIILKDDQENIIDEVYYGNWQAPTGAVKAPAASDPNSLARQNDGTGTFIVTQTPTKGAANQITPLPVPTITTTITDNNPEEVQIDYKTIIINEILPNPAGSDLTEEFIELKNIGANPIDLAGYQLSDNSKMIYKLTAKDFSSTMISPNEFFVIKRKISGLALNNDTDYVKLISPTDKTLQTIKFTENPVIPEDVSYSRDEQNDWFWNTTITENKANVITKLNHAPIIEIYCPKEALVGELIICDASDSYDLENNDLKFTWEINNRVFTDVIAQYQFNQAGTFTITLTVSDNLLSAVESQKIKIAESKTTITQVKAAAAKTTAAKKSTAAAEDVASRDELKNIKNYATGTTVITQGVVSALPNTFGKTIMYLAGSGIQLYMSKADWPELKIGDLVEIYGTLAESQGTKRLKLASAQDIVVLENETQPEPHEIKIKEINDGIIDYLVQISGQLIEKNGTKFALKDETGEAEVYISANTKINKTYFLEGDNLTVTGIVRKYNNVFQVLPRFQDDIVKIVPTKQQEATVLPAQKQTGTVLNFLIAAAVMLGLGVVAIVIYKNKIKKAEV
jgi:DNA/RNA endonuclease YhcR with UshA esterase domain